MKVKKFLKNIFSGAANILDVEKALSDLPYEYDDPNPWYTDYMAIKRDWEKVWEDLKIAIHSHYVQTAEQKRTR